jgi:hypothetical protein
MEHKTLNIAIKACKMVIACLLLLATAALDSTAKPHYLLLNSHPSITLKTYSLKRKDTPSFTLEDKNGKKEDYLN